MSHKQIFFSKIIFAQIGAFFISSLLVKHVFLEGIPLVRPEFKEEVRQSPQLIKATMSSVVLTLKEKASLEIKREDIPDEKGTVGTLPPPWVFEPQPTRAGEQFPTQEPERPTVTLAPTVRAPVNAPTNNPIPTWFGDLDPPTPTNPPTRVPLPTATPFATSQPSSSGNASLEQETITLINQRRQGMGLSALSVNTHLTSATRRHSSDMSTNKFCNHTGSDGSDSFKRAKEAGFAGNVYGETIGCGHSSAQSIVDGWWSSPSHKEILTKSSVRLIGVGWVGNYQTASVAF